MNDPIDHFQSEWRQEVENEDLAGQKSADPYLQRIAKLEKQLAAAKLPPVEWIQDIYTITKLRAALERLVGASTREELQAMKDAIAMVPACEEGEDALCGINTLLETLPK